MNDAPQSPLSPQLSRFKMVVVAHLLLIKQGSVLLARRFNTGYEDGKFSVPAGHVEAEESVLEALQREAQEEVGVAIEGSQLKLAHVMHRYSDRQQIDFFFVADAWQGEPEIKEPDKCDAIEWHAVGQLPDNTIPYVRQAIAHWQRESYYSERRET